MNKTKKSGIDGLIKEFKKHQAIDKSLISVLEEFKGYLKRNAALMKNIQEGDRKAIRKSILANTPKFKKRVKKEAKDMDIE
jgi:hypothetical protein